MKILKYTLFPEAYGYNGKFVDKIGTIGELVVDMGLLINSDFDKVIHKLDILNILFAEGIYGRSGEWDPFQLNQSEYNQLIEYLLSLPLSRKYRIEN